MHDHFQRRHGTSFIVSSSNLNTLGSRSVGGTKIDSTTIIIIAVCGSVGVVVLTLLIWRAIRACCSNSVPLPPIQPLGHYREQQQELGTWTPLPNSSSMLGIQARTHLRAEASFSSLLPTRQTSFQESTTDTLDSSPVRSESLGLPNPSFQRSHGSFRSQEGRDSGLVVIASSDDLLDPPAEATSMMSSSHSPSNHSHVSSTTQQTATGSRSHKSRSRPLSMISSASTSYTSVSGPYTRNMIRGSPHGPHSSIQIVLPAPLAPQLRPYLNSGSVEDLSSRDSYVDKWALPSRSTSMRLNSERSASLGSSSPRSRRSKSLAKSKSQSSLSPFPVPPRSTYPRQESDILPTPPLPPLPPHIPTTLPAVSYQQQILHSQQQIHMSAETSATLIANRALQRPIVIDASSSKPNLQ